MEDGVQGDLFGRSSPDELLALSVAEASEESIEVEAAPDPDEPKNGFDEATAYVEEARTQDTLFGDLDIFTVWRTEWRGMPEFVQDDLMPWNSVIINFESRRDLRAFAELISQNLTLKTRSVWYPEAEIGRITTKRYKDVGGDK